MSTQVTTEASPFARERRNEPMPRPRDSFPGDGRGTARGLGWFSIGLGLAEVLAPRAIAQTVGARRHDKLIRAYGVREIASGIGILANPQPAGWLWTRVAGDMVDLASLGLAAKTRRNGRGKALFGVASVAGVTLLDIRCAARLSEENSGCTWRRAEANIAVEQPPEECYRYWANLENLPRFVSYLESVRSTSEGRSHWVASGPGGARVEWDAVVVDDVPNQRISWRSVDGSKIRHSGSVEFQGAPGGRGTVVRIQMDYGHPFQSLGPLAKLLGKGPEQMIRKELRRFKQVLETGEVLTTEGQPSGRDSSVTWIDRAAR